MNCISAICMYIAATSGIQYSQVGDSYLQSLSRSNHYGGNVGSLSIGIELNNGMFFEFEHTSGFNTNELDGGMNVIQFGYKLYLFGDK